MAKTQQTSLIVLDNTVLTNFGLTRRPDLILSLWPGTACTTQAVIAEYLAGVEAAGLPPEAWVDLPIIVLNPAEEAFLLSLPQRLGAGERTCLTIAVNRKAILATDDYDARQFARRGGLTIIGTVGILVHAVEKGLIAIEEAQGLLETMIATGYRSPIQRLEEILGK